MNKTTDDIATRLHEAADAIAQVGTGRSRRAGASEKIEAEWERLKGDISALVGDGTLAATPEIEALLGRLKAGVGKAGETLVEGGRQLSQTARTHAGDVDAYAHRAPWRLAAIAAAGGLLVGALLKRR